MRILIGTLAGCAALAVVGAAVANAPGLYLGGGVALRGTIAELNYVGTTVPLKPKFDIGPSYAITLGFRAPVNVRVEAQLGYGSNGSSESSQFKGTLEQWTGMANIFYDLPITDRLALTVGGGGGYVKTVGHLTGKVDGLTYMRGGDYAPVWQAVGGVALQVTEQFELFADYRYQEYGSSQHNSSFTAFNPVRFDDAHSHMFMMGFRFFPQPLYL